MFSSYFSSDCPSSSHPQLAVVSKSKFRSLSSEDAVDTSLARVPCHYIKTARQMERLGVHLNSVREFAFDLEHTLPNHKTQQTCLLQISTRREDFIIDILNPQVRNRMHLLKNAFENEGIVKVAHGQNDVHWMERDFGILTVPLLDTFTVGLANVEHVNGLSLDRLICFSCGVRLYKSKSFIAGVDWTKRPLSERLIKYARLDTHFLLSAKDFITKELEDVSQPVKIHRLKMARAFVRLHYSLSDGAARRFRELFLPIWKQSQKTNI
ncbi:hypothetical protein niasHT_006789 [Heterodera trifolii]|uniref:3'-5' exonuclease domain-containing protein n=1 Tax=Heterodera trifolii TaxID=157864 RepID=A0ABD2M6Z9_9BILA